MKRLLPLVLLIGIATLARPALAEEVKVLVDLPVPLVDDLQWFPGGRYLLVTHWADDNSIHSAVVDVETGKWKPVEWVANRKQLGKKPWTCIRIYCDVVVSAEGNGIRVDNIQTDPACADWINDEAMKGRYAMPGNILYDAAFPPNIAISASGRYALMRYQGENDEGYLYTGFWIIRLEKNGLEEWMAWEKALEEHRREPLIWELPADRYVWMATWLYDPAGKPDRIAIVTGDPATAGEQGDAWYESLRLLVLEVRP